LLYRVSPHDPWAFTLAPLILIGTTLLASGLPARRATRVNPLVALRTE
jgi:putative ABC transport system permease protein